jgi:RNA polymerase sigma-70 factor (ECF subfamily)
MIADPTVSFEQQLVGHRHYLLKFARLQLRNETWAEDAVSETLLAALSKPQSFANRSQIKTWLVGILKHKVIDVFRVNARTVSLDMQDDGPSADEALDTLVFRANGHFAQPPADWGNPDQDLQSRQFMVILEACTEKMPPAMARVFLMREWLELSSEEICNELGLSSTNLYVTLHRARLRLRECLELNWFGDRTGSR